MNTQDLIALAEALKYWHEQSDGITVGVPSELVQAIHAALTCPEVQADNKRERFEHFMRTSRASKGRKHIEKALERMEGGDYVDDHTQRHWWTWQSALGLTRHAVDATAPPERSDVQGAEGLARQFHEAYERLAPKFHYATRPASRMFDPESSNGQLMIAVCTELLASRPAVQQEGWSRADVLEEAARLCEWRGHAIDNSGKSYVRSRDALDCARAIRDLAAAPGESNG